MTIAVIDNGSLEPAAHLHLRTVASALQKSAGLPVTAVSWKHSDRIASSALGGPAAWTLGPWVRSCRARGETDFVFVPFFVSPQGAIGSALRKDLETLQRETGGFEFSFTEGLSSAISGVMPLVQIVDDRVRSLISEKHLSRPPIIVVDHGGPSSESAALRDQIANTVRATLAESAGVVAAASMESPDGPEYAFNRPLLEEQLRAPGFDRGDVVIAPLFLSPGRHAGPNGDLAKIAHAAESASPALRCHFAGLVGSHLLARQALARQLALHLNPAAVP